MSILLFSVSFAGRAQIFGGTSPAIKWKQINIPEARIIFPAGLDSTANRIAEDIHFTAKPTRLTIGPKMKKVDIVLRNTGLASNGYVGLGPFRSEFYLTPPPNPFELGSTPWADLLAAHEYRHVQQYNNFNVGLSHVMRVVFGQEGQALANSGSVPDWFFEGDAVYNETNVSRQGRGSLPYFYNGFRALWSENRNYSWMKLRNGSYRDFVPDKYILGFMLTAYGREKYGTAFWKNVTHDAAAFKSVFYPLQSALSRYSGQSYRSFRDSALAFFQKQFADAPSDIPQQDFRIGEQFPVFDTAGDLMYLRSSAKEIPAFVIRRNGKDEKIRTADVMVDDYFSYAGGQIVYASRRYHPRWTYKAWNEVRLLDVATGKERRVTHKTRYFSPSLNKGADKIVAVNLKTDQTASLDVLNVRDGRVEKSFSDSSIISYYHPVFYNDTVICAVARGDGKMSLMKVDILNGGKPEFLLPMSDNVIGFPTVHRDTLYFSVSQKTNDELMAYCFADRTLYQVTSAAPSIGKYHAAISDSSIAWTTFIAQGKRLVILPKRDIAFKPTDYSVITSSFKLMAINDVNANLLYRFQDTLFSVSRYSALTRPFHFHSLEPSASDPEYTLSLVGENILNTVQSTIDFTYNRADRSKTAGINVSYGGLFPVFSFGYNYAVDRRFAADNRFVYYNTSEPYAGFYIPLNLSRGRYLRSMSLGSAFKYNYRAMQKPFQDHYKDASFSFLNNTFSFSNQVQVAPAQVLPRFAQSVYANYRFPLGHRSGYQYLLRGRLYLPGIGITNSLNFTLAYSQKDTLNQIGFSNAFPFARGYDAPNLHKMTGFQANYQLPILYPETGFANIAYLLRLRANFFFDQTHVLSYTTTKEIRERDFRSGGAEIFFDTKWWNQVAVSFGVRYSYLFDQNAFGTDMRGRWEIIMPVNLFNR